MDRKERKIYCAEQLGEMPWWLIAIQLIVLGPVSLLAAIHAVLSGLAHCVEWLGKGRSWTQPFGRASDAIEAWWYRRQIRRME